MTVFADYVEADGGEFVPEEGSIAQEWMNIAQSLIANRVAEGSKSGETMRLVIGWVNDNEFNAWAESHPDTDIIALNIGIVEVLLGIYRGILSDPDVLATAGQPAELSEDRFYFDDSVIKLPSNSKEWPNKELRNRQREQDAREMALASFIYIVEHEFAHLANGHVDFGNCSLGLNRLLEIGGPSSSDTALTRQTFEWDADLSATQDVLKYALAPEITLVGGRQKWSLPERNFLGTQRDAIANTGVVSAIVHLIFADLDEAFHPSLATRNHPPSIIRLIFTMSQIGHVLWFRAGWERSIAEDAGWRDVGVVIRRINEMLPGRPKAAEGITDSLFLIAQELHERYMIEYRKILPELDHFKRGGLLAPAEPDNDPL